MNEYDVFISYRRGGDSFTAILLQRQLQSKSKSVFLDVDDIKSGYFDEKLLHTIENTPNFLIILSPGSLDRCIDSDDWVRKEIEHALKTNRNIIPIMMEGFNFNKVNLPESISELKRHNGIPCIHMFFDPMIEKLLTFLKPTTKTENKEGNTLQIDAKNKNTERNPYSKTIFEDWNQYENFLKESKVSDSVIDITKNIFEEIKKLHHQQFEIHFTPAYISFRDINAKGRRKQAFSIAPQKNYVLLGCLLGDYIDHVDSKFKEKYLYSSDENWCAFKIQNIDDFYTNREFYENSIKMGLEKTGGTIKVSDMIGKNKIPLMAEKSPYSELLKKYSIINQHADSIINNVSDNFVSEYNWLLNELGKPNFVMTEDFKARYQKYWVFQGVDANWRGTYFGILQNKKNEKNISLEEICRNLFNEPSFNDHKRLHYSFSTKMVHMIEPTNPIYDKHIKEFYSDILPIIPDTNETFENRLKEVLNSYKILMDEYARILNEGLLKISIEKFKKRVTNTENFTDQRIIDSILFHFNQIKENLI